MPKRIDTLAREMAQQLNPEQLAELVAKVKAQTARVRTINECPTPLDLAARHDTQTVRTPALELLARRLTDTIQTRDGRLIVSVPPQSGKSTLLRWLVLWALADDPTRRIVFASYEHGLARASGRMVRNLVLTHGAEMGLGLSQDHADAADWQLDGHPGGLFTTGVGGALTGRPSDLLLVDDALKGQQDADSAVMRGRLHEWWASTARTRLAPGAPAVVVGTRWHEDDLSGRLASEGWPVLNIPALADGQVPDALDRPMGEWLVSARGTTVADWEKLRAESGERAFYSLMQGAPAPPAGGIFQQVWIDQHRVTEAPPLVRIEVGVDPADTGTGDAAGILVGGRAADGHAYILADLSGPYSRAQWARIVCLAAVRWDANTVVSERTLGMQTAITEAWSVIRRQGTALKAAGGVDPVPAALAALTLAGDEVAGHEEQLREVAPHVDEILARPSTGPCRTVFITAKQNKQVRAEAVTVHYETGRCHHVGRLAELEHEQVTWQPGQKSPNRLDTLAHLLTHLQASAQVEIRAPRPTTRVPTRTGSSRAAR